MIDLRAGIRKDNPLLPRREEDGPAVRTGILEGSHPIRHGLQALTVEHVLALLQLNRSMVLSVVFQADGTVLKLCPWCRIVKSSPILTSAPTNSNSRSSKFPNPKTSYLTPSIDGGSSAPQCSSSRFEG
jgi:hypothetical protein